MIAALAFAALLQTPGPDIEALPAQTDGIVSVEALVRLPKMGGFDRACLAVLREVILDDTQDYGHRRLLDYTTPSGEPIGCDMLPDCLRIHYGLNVADRTSAVPILENVLHEATLNPETIQHAIKELPTRTKGYWESALDTGVPRYSEVRPDDVVQMYHRIMRPENFTITVAGPPAIADFPDRFRSAISAWDLSPVRVLVDHESSGLVGLRSGDLTTIVLRSNAFNPTGPEIAANLLAIFGLDGGKGSAVWRGIREGLGWSYRQEAVLRNSVVGIEPAIVVVTLRSDQDTDRALAIRPAVEKIVTAWTEADRVRALAMAKARFNRDVGPDPIYFLGSRPSSENTVFMASYWRMKTGHDWNPALLLGAMENVDIDSMRKAAMAMLESADVEIIRGKGS